MRQKLQPKLRDYRSNLAKRKVSATEAERSQYGVLDRYAASAQVQKVPQSMSRGSLSRTPSSCRRHMFLSA